MSKRKSQFTIKDLGALCILGLAIYLLQLVFDYWYISIIFVFAYAIYKILAMRKTKENRIIALKYHLDDLNGIEFENCLAELISRFGYSHVETTKATGDFGIDILCRDSDLYCGIQCKRYSKHVGVKAIQEAIAGAQYYHLDYTIVATNSYFTDSAKKLARKGNVTLWDRDTIINMLKNC